MKRIILTLFMVFTLTACQSAGQKPEKLDFFAMDTYMSITSYGKNAKTSNAQIETAIKNIEDMISRTLKTSDIYKLNNAGAEPVSVSDETYTIIKTAIEYAKKTGGAFDPAVASLTDLWMIGTEGARLPAPDEINNARESVGYENVILMDNNTVKLLNGVKLDFGGIGKGIAADISAGILKENKINKAIVALAGNIYALGSKEKDAPWKIGIANPKNPQESIATLSIIDKTVVTTGAYERFFEKDGIRYHHIFDSKTGYPVESDIQSVTIISDNSTLADAYSTALFVMGKDKALEFQKKEKTFDAVIITQDNEVITTDGVRDLIEITSEEYYEAT